MGEEWHEVFQKEIRTQFHGAKIPTQPAILPGAVE